MGEAAPALYTVEEAAKLLRIGRTKAYALTQEWRATSGASGLPVVDFGHVLRVPRAALEKLLGVDLASSAATPADAAAPDQVNQPGDESPSAPAAAPTTHRGRPRDPAGSDQLDLFTVAS